LDALATAADRTTAFYTGTPEPGALPEIDPTVRYR
jgi:hypothetical protein